MVIRPQIIRGQAKTLNTKVDIVNFAKNNKLKWSVTPTKMTVYIRVFSVSFFEKYSIFHYHITPDGSASVDDITSAVESL